MSASPPFSFPPGYGRKQLIRDASLAFLTEPRSAREIADHIGRPVPTATGHLAAMRRKGLVPRIGYAAYARADYSGPAVDFFKRKDAVKPRVASPQHDVAE